MTKQWAFRRVPCSLRSLLRATVGVALVLALPGCLDVGIGGCTMHPSFRAILSVPADDLANPNARPSVEGQVAVGSQHPLEIRAIGDSTFCGEDPDVSWHLTNPEAVRIEGRRAIDSVLTAIAPGHTQISATVVYGGATSEVTLSWCQPPPGGDQMPRSQCTWIPMSGVRVVP
jgi:hypothetical protein